MIRSSSVVPLRGMPTMKIGSALGQPAGVPAKAGCTGYASMIQSTVARSLDTS